MNKKKEWEEKGAGRAEEIRKMIHCVTKRELEMGSNGNVYWDNIHEVIGTYLRPEAVWMEKTECRFRGERRDAEKRVYLVSRKWMNTEPLLGIQARDF